MHPTNRTPPQRQRGSVVINATIALSLLVIVLVGVELGYLFFMKREYQKTADLAALAGAQKLTNSNAATLCSLAESSAIANALKNSSGATIQPECGNWNPDNESNNNESDCFKGIIDRFNKNSTEINAVRVRISQSPPRCCHSFLARAQFACKQWHHLMRQSQHSPSALDSCASKTIRFFPIF